MITPRVTRRCVALATIAVSCSPAWAAGPAGDQAARPKLRYAVPEAGGLADRLGAHVQR